MTQEEMVSTLAKGFAKSCIHVSGPLYFEGQGPYLMIMGKDEYFSYRFECFDITTEESFLAAPDKFPKALRTNEFFLKATDPMNLDGIKDFSHNFVFLLRKLIPDTPSCRKKLQELSKTDPFLVLHALVIAPSGKVVDASDCLEVQTDTADL
jgi:hypothetical protein